MAIILTRFKRFKTISCMSCMDYQFENYKHSILTTWGLPLYFCLRYLYPIQRLYTNISYFPVQIDPHNLNQYFYSLQAECPYYICVKFKVLSPKKWLQWPFYEQGKLQNFSKVKVTNHLKNIHWPVFLLSDNKPQQMDTSSRIKKGCPSPTCVFIVVRSRFNTPVP